MNDNYKSPYDTEIEPELGIGWKILGGVLLVAFTLFVLSEIGKTETYKQVKEKANIAIDAGKAMINDAGEYIDSTAKSYRESQKQENK